MQGPQLLRFIGDEDPIKIWWFLSGSLINFSTGYTFTAKLAAFDTPETVIFTKTTGFTGAAGSGTQNSGTPNLTVAWNTSGELNSLTTKGVYWLEIVAQATDTSQSTFRCQLTMLKRLGS